jgi:hypothetical protein
VGPAGHEDLDVPRPPVGTNTNFIPLPFVPAEMPIGAAAVGAAACTHRRCIEHLDAGVDTGNSPAEVTAASRGLRSRPS